MIKLYLVTFDHRNVVAKAFSVLVSERNQKLAVSRARRFIATIGDYQICLYETRSICSTSDDVLELA